MVFLQGIVFHSDLSFIQHLNRYLHSVRELRKQGHEVHVATPVPDAPDEYLSLHLLYYK